MNITAKGRGKREDQYTPSEAITQRIPGKPRVIVDKIVKVNKTIMPGNTARNEGLICLVQLLITCVNMERKTDGILLDNKALNFTN